MSPEARASGSTTHSVENPLADPRRKSLFASEGSRYSHVVISAPSIPSTGLPFVADAAVLLVTRGTSTPGWVFETARSLARDGNAPPSPS